MPVAGADWRDIADRVHAAVDDRLGEPIHITPWAASEFSSGSPDVTRQEVDAFGTLAVPATTTGLAVERGGDFRAVESDLVVAIRWSSIASANPRKGDRVALTQRGWICEITYIEPRKTDRVIMHLVRK